MSGKQWTRIEELISRLDRLTEEDRSGELERLTHHGESTEVMSYLRLNYALQPNPRIVTLGQKVGGKYTLTDKIAAGGMGIVYRAKQDLVGREVAVKMIHPALANAKMFAKLKEEISTMGRLQHTGVVRIFDADIHHFDPDGKHGAVFYTMELVEGPTMRKWMQEQHPSFEQKLDFFAQVCEAVAYAHEKGVIHRDLKPENILVRPNLMPAMLDFGLSRVMSEATKSGELDVGSLAHASPDMDLSGTPAYMSPEKWAQTGDDHRGDVYALGVMLHELIWGSRPLEFDTCDSFEEMQETALSWTFKGIPKDQREGVDEPVIRIMPRLLSREPEKRPQSAKEIADVIRCVLEKRQRMRRLKKRAPLLIGIAAVVVLTLFWSVKTSDHMRRMEASRNALAEANSILRNRSAHARSQALALVPDALEDRHSELDWRQLAVEAMNTWEMTYETVSIERCTRILSIAEDGKRVLGIHQSGQLALFQNGDEMLLGDPPFEPEASLIHPTRPVVALASDAGKINVYSGEHGLETALDGEVIQPSSMTFSPDGAWFAIATQPEESEYDDKDGPSSDIKVYGTEHWKRKPILFKNDGSVSYLPEINSRLSTITGLVYSPDASMLASWSSVDSGMVMVWDAKAGTLRDAFFCGGPVVHVQWNRAGQDLLCVREDGMAYTWENRAWTGLTRKMPLSDGIYLQNIDPSNIGSIGWLPDDSGMVWQDAKASRVNIRQSGDTHTISLTEVGEGLSMHWVHAIGGWLGIEGNRVHRWQFEMGAHHALMASLTERASFAFIPGTSVVALGDLRGVMFLDFQHYTPLGHYVLPLSGPVVAPSDSEELWFFTKWAGPVGFYLDFRPESKTLHINQHYKKDQGTAGVMAFYDRVTTLAATKGKELFVGYQQPKQETLKNERTDTDQAGDVRYLFQTLSIGSECQFLSFSSDGRWLAAGSLMDSWVKLWHKEQDLWVSSDLRTRAGIPHFINRSTHQLLIAESDRIVVHDLGEKNSERSVSVGLDLITCMAECSVNPLLAIAHSQGVSIHAIDSSFSRLFLLPLKLGEADRVRSVQFSPDGSKLVALVERTSHSAIHVWDMERIMDTMKHYRLESVNWQCDEPEEAMDVEQINLIRTIYNPYLE